MEESRIVTLLQQAQSLPRLMAALQAEGAEPYQRSSALKSFLQYKARERALPLSGLFELTPLCNLDCKMCYVHLNAAQLCGKTPLSAAQWEHIMGQAVEQGMLYASLSGGECLTYPDFDRLYGFLHRHGVQVSVLTNGVLLQEERIRFFQAHPPARIQVTLYGSDDDAYERVTGHRLFDTVLSNIRRADAAQLPIMMVLTPSRYSQADNLRLIELAAATGIRFEINSAIMPPREETGRADQDDGISFAEYFRLLKRKMALTGGTIPEECLIDLPSPAKDGEEKPQGLRCGGGRSSFSVNWQGQMLPCNRLTSLAEDVLTQDFAAAWRKIHEAAMHYPLPCECEGCAYSKVQYGCAAAHLPEGAAGHASPKMCEWCRELVRSGLRKLD